VFHDDQHGTAIVVTAALLNGAKLVGKSLADLRVVITGAGAAGTAVAHMLHHYGVPQITVCDREGALHTSRRELFGVKAELARRTNPERLRGTADDVLLGADVYIGLSQPGAVTMEGIRRMAPDPIVFCLANPVPELAPEDLEGVASVVATGRSDYPNQINNVLAFPGIFRGALDSGSTEITDGMKAAAVEAIAGCVPENEVGPHRIIPTVFDPHVVTAVAGAVEARAIHDNVTRRS
jgi:malate dehydrogenase (oxaloacetate-decarboxylating)